MILRKYAQKKMLKKEASYLSNQQELESYQRLGIKEYTFLGSGCDICTKLNGKSFFINDAEVGVNFPPIHPNCKCTIKAKTKMDLFKDRQGVNPLKDNPRFKEWIKRQQKSI